LNYRNLNDLGRAILDGLRHFNLHGFDVIAGMPRSGMIPASILSLYLDRKSLVLATAEQLAAHKGKRILVVDDTISSGKANARKRAELEPLKLGEKYLAVFYRQASRHRVDYAFQPVEGNRLFEWDLFHSPGVWIRQACLDIDGVICVNPRKDEDYEAFLANARPFCLPKVKVPWLVTARKEKYRKLTEEWMKKHKVQYGDLVMRKNDEPIIPYKARVYRLVPARLFVESDPAIAEGIFRLTGKPVLSFPQNRMYAR
jgi:hypoxanthine phosphoribosyltransferase